MRDKYSFKTQTQNKQSIQCHPRPSTPTPDFDRILGWFWGRFGADFETILGTILGITLRTILGRFWGRFWVDFEDSFGLPGTIFSRITRKISVLTDKRFLNIEAISSGPKRGIFAVFGVKIKNKLHKHLCRNFFHQALELFFTGSRALFQL
jgi:hypothetical protein